MKKAYVFPGQGSQFPGMAKDLYESDARAKEMLEKADEILGFRITDIMFNGTPEELKATKVTQPAVFLHSTVLAKCYGGFQPDMVAGHSLGEFSALAAAGAMDFEDALKLVSIRAQAMHKAYELKPSTMDAIIALPTEKVEEICRELVPKIRKWVGIPVSIGVAPTKTLAKIASHFAKKFRGYRGVCVIDSDLKRQKALELTPIGEVWGVGRRNVVKMQDSGVRTAADFVARPEEWVDRHFAVPGVRTWKELQGIVCG